MSSGGEKTIPASWSFLTSVTSRALILSDTSLDLPSILLFL